MIGFDAPFARSRQQEGRRDILAVLRAIHHYAHSSRRAQDKGRNQSRALAELAPEMDVSAAAFPHMSMREGSVRGVPARVFRISFTGELGFEIQVPAGHGLAVWEACIEAGARYGITAYGTEAMHVLRAEKGYIIAGQDTDGTVTPHDLGMGAALVEGYLKALDAELLGIAGD